MNNEAEQLNISYKNLKARLTKPGFYFTHFLLYTEFMKQLLSISLHITNKLHAYVKLIKMNKFDSLKRKITEN